MATPTTDHRHEACTEEHGHMPASSPFRYPHCAECGDPMPRPEPEPEPCGVCGKPAGTSGFVPEVEPVSLDDLDAPSGSEARRRAEQHVLALCTRCWSLSLEARAECASGCYWASADMQYQRGLLTTDELAAGAPPVVIHRSPCPVVRRLVAAR